MITETGLTLSYSKAKAVHLVSLGIANVALKCSTEAFENFLKASQLEERYLLWWATKLGASFSCCSKQRPILVIMIMSNVILIINKMAKNMKYRFV